jgi:hypothetical protein
MKIKDRLKEMDFEPKSKQVNKHELKLLLYNVRRSVFFCWHDWVYWTFGVATKRHRVCRKCLKKQQDMQIIPKHRSRWIKERHYA